VKKEKKVVSSKVERTKDSRSISLQKYHSQVSKMGRSIQDYAVGLCRENLLSVKMALMEAVRGVEVMMKERREK